jgi:carbamoyl-phosphate synthase large subunit
MKSTGEVMGLDRDFARAFLKSQLGAGVSLPKDGRAFISVKDADKAAIVPLARELVTMGFSLVATSGTARWLQQAGLEAETILKVHEGRPHVVDAVISGTIALLINTAEGPKAIADSFDLRRAALMNHVPYYTTVSGATAAMQAIAALRGGQLEVAPLQSYFMGSF